MNIANLRSENGYITRFDIALRLQRFNLPADEVFFLRRIPGRCFSKVGATFQGESLPFFEVYTGNRDAYLYIQEMFHGVAEELECQAESDEASDEIPGSEIVVGPA